MFVILSNRGDIFLYPEGYLNICNNPYTNENLILDAHLTNEYLKKDGSTNNQQLVTSKWPEFKNILPEIKTICQQVFLPWFKNNDLKPNSYAILGCDFMLDSNKKLWLLEINHGACFPVNNQHPLFESLYKPLWHHFVTEIINI